jgi:alkanesulfonate monooxygenase SsuD/methylene tetrahydromethanopterin reductase-like flavin-dependent oxidoreductase (luciferase family)
VAVEIVLRAWTEERLSFAGTHFRFDDVEVLPKPLQRPRPPVWMAATSESSIDWAAGQGFSILMDPHSAHGDLGRKRRYYAERLEAAGYSLAGRDLPMARLLALGDSAGEAEGVARRGAEWIVNSYFGAAHNLVGIKDPTVSGADPVQRYLDGVILYGTVASVLDQILRLHEEIGLDYLLAAPLSHRSFMLLTEKILPKLP